MVEEKIIEKIRKVLALTKSNMSIKLDQVSRPLTDDR